MQVVWLILRDVLVQLTLGVMLGIARAFAAGRVIQSLFVADDQRRNRVHGRKGHRRSWAYSASHYFNLTMPAVAASVNSSVLASVFQHQNRSMVRASAVVAS